DEPRDQLLDISAARALLGELAEDGDRGGIADGRCARQRPSLCIEREPGATAAALVRAEIGAPGAERLGGEDPRDLLAGCGVRLRGSGDALEVVAERHARIVDSPECPRFPRERGMRASSSRRSARATTGTRASSRS